MTCPLDMPLLVLLPLFGGLVTMTVVMQLPVAWWKCFLGALAVGSVAVPAAWHGLPFWVAFYLPWLLGVLLGSAVGALAREERLTALLLTTSAAVTSVVPLYHYQSAVDWKPPWTTTDIALISFVELINLTIFTWLTAALLLVCLGLLIAGPINLAALALRDSASLVTARTQVNTWFLDRVEIVFAILNVISFVGSSNAERQQARLKHGLLPSQRDRPF